MLEFKPEYHVGVPRIDAQHRKLFDYFNQLEQAMRQGKGREVVAQVLASLLAYTREHFTFEEELMQRAGYPELAQHKRIHEAFVEQLARHQTRHQQGELGVTIDLAQSLAEWLRKHILGVDQQYVPHVKQAKVA